MSSSSNSLAFISNAPSKSGFTSKYDFSSQSIPEEIIEDVINQSSVIQNIALKLGKSPNPTEVEWDIKGFWVKKKLWKSAKNILRWIENTFK